LKATAFVRQFSSNRSPFFGCVLSSARSASVAPVAVNFMSTQARGCMGSAIQTVVGRLIK
jgi:hypothetical protein